MSEQQDKEFAEGIYWDDPSPKAPDFVRGRISIQTKKFHAWLEERLDSDYVNLQVKESQKGNLYIEVDHWKPSKVEKPKVEVDEPPQNAGIDEDDIPF